MENLTDKKNKCILSVRWKKGRYTVPALKKKANEREKSYIPLLLPVDSNLSFKMAHTKNQRRLAN